MADFPYLDPPAFGYVRFFEMANFPYLDPTDIGHVCSCCLKFARFPVQICHSYYYVGYCRYGDRCKFLHVFRTMYGTPVVLRYSPEQDYPSKHSVGCFKKLEIEVVRLLEFRRGIPVSVYSLPILYYDTYGKKLRLAEGYNLPRVLKLMTRYICLFGMYSFRPHGQQAIILVDDLRSHRYERFMEECGANTRQVILTFPPQSMLSLENVYYYFKNFGMVTSVNIPIRESTTSGSVNFAYPETVALVLTKRNPHFICQTQVQVRPYRPEAMGAQ